MSLPKENNQIQKWEIFHLLSILISFHSEVDESITAEMKNQL